MAEDPPKLGPGRLATEGGVGTALSYYLHEATTTWLGWLPALPGDSGELRWWALIASGGAVLAGLGRAACWVWATFGPRKRRGGPEARQGPDGERKEETTR